MDQAFASSSKFMKELKGTDIQYTAMGQAIADFWDTSDVIQDPIVPNIPSYPSLESLDQEPKDELTEAQYGYYSLEREIIMEKLAAAYEIYCTHLKEYEEADPKKKSQKYLLQYNDISNRLHGQFEVAASMLALPFEESLFTYPALDYIMDMVEQKDLSGKGMNFFQELMREIEIKNAIAEKVLQNRYTIAANSSEMAGADKLHRDYQKESKRLMDFCRKMIDRRDKEGYIDLEQPQGVPDVKPISKKELDEKIAEAIIKPKKAQTNGENTIPPHYSWEMTRYEPPLPVKKREQEEVLEKVREMTKGDQKGVKVKNRQRVKLNSLGIMRD